VLEMKKTSIRKRSLRIVNCRIAEDRCIKEINKERKNDGSEGKVGKNKSKP
jgi:hypothetical protein